MLTINTNVNALKLTNNLSRVTSALDNAFVRLSTGAKINSASDGAADLMLSKGLKTQISGLSVCNNNAQMAKNILGVADGVLTEVVSIAQRLRDISLMAANGMYSLTERVAFQQEADSLIAEIKRQISEARFNDYKLFKEDAVGSGASPAVYGAGGSGGSEPAPMMYAARPEMASAPAMATGPVITQAEAEAAGYTWVTTGEQLEFAILNNEDIALGGNIDLSTYGDWAPGGTYTGTFEGNNYTISGLTSTSQGLFYSLDGAEIRNLNLENINISNDGGLGGLANFMQYSCQIENVHIKSGAIYSGDTTVGGLIGYAYECGGNSSSIINCSTNVTVEGNASVGGLVGSTDIQENSSLNISGCKTTGETKATSDGGGDLLVPQVAHIVRQ